MKRCLLPILTLILICNLFIMPNRIESSETNNTAEVAAVIKGAVENCQWWFAKDQTELRLILGQYYTGELLEVYTIQLNNIINIPTGWHWLIEVVETDVIYIDEGQAIAITSLVEKDELDGDVKPAEAIYQLHWTEDGWRIAEVEYYWE